MLPEVSKVNLALCIHVLVIRESEVEEPLPQSFPLSHTVLWFP